MSESANMILMYNNGLCGIPHIDPGDGEKTSLRNVGS